MFKTKDILKHIEEVEIILSDSSVFSLYSRERATVLLKLVEIKLWYNTYICKVEGEEK